MSNRLPTLTTLLALLVLAMAGALTPGVSHAYPCSQAGSDACDRVPVVGPVSGARAVVGNYFAALDAGMATGDFSRLSGLFARRAVVTVNTAQGQMAAARGLTAIEVLYQRARQNQPGMRWTPDTVYRLSKGVILSYAHAEGPATGTSPRSTEVFVIQSGRITRLSSTTF